METTEHFKALRAMGFVKATKDEGETVFHWLKDPELQVDFKGAITSEQFLERIINAMGDLTFERVQHDTTAYIAELNDRIRVLELTLQNAKKEALDEFRKTYFNSPASIGFKMKNNE